MKTHELLKFRPANDSVAGLQAAIANIDARLGAVPGEIAMLDTAYSDLIATGTAAEIDAHTAKLDDLRETLKQLTTLRQAIEPKLAEAMQRDKLVELRAAGEAANELNRTAVMWALGEYRELAAKIIHGLELERQAAAAIARYHQQKQNSGLAPELVASLPRINDCYTTRDGLAKLFQLVDLPAALATDGSDETPVIYCASGKLGQQSFIGTISAASVARGRTPQRIDPARSLTQEEVDALEVKSTRESRVVRTPGTPAPAR